MEIYFDSREKMEHIQHILKRFDELGVTYERKALKTGDYIKKEDAGSDKPHIVIERKGGLEELSYNFCSDRIRFRKELKRASDSNIRLIILIADEQRTCLEDVLDWMPSFNAPNRRMNGMILYKLIQNAIEQYKDAISFQFCKPDKMADEIIRFLS